MPCPPTLYRAMLLAMAVVFVACHGEPRSITPPEASSTAAGGEPSAEGTPKPEVLAAAVPTTPSAKPAPNKDETLDADVEERLRVGIGLIREEKFDEAQTWFEKMANERKDSAAAPYNLGWLHDRAGRLELAIEQYRQAITLDPYHPRAYNNLGYALQKAGQTDDAIDTWIEGIAKVPGNQFARNNLKKLITQLRCPE